MKKPDEIALYAAVRHDRALHGFCVEPVDVIAGRLGIPRKRALGLAEKWYERGWVTCGVHIRRCSFTINAPQALLPWSEVP